MNRFTYGTVTEYYSFLDVSRISYGIAIYAHEDFDHISTVISSVHDISAEKDLIEELVFLCNFYQLDPVHLCDIIDDFLAS